MPLPGPLGPPGGDVSAAATGLRALVGWGNSECGGGLGGRGRRARRHPVAVADLYDPAPPAIPPDFPPQFDPPTPPGVAFDPEKTTFSGLMGLFWENHDPTQGMRQGNDLGTQYRSGIYVTSDSQKEEARSSLRRFQRVLDTSGYGPITTEVEDLGAFYYAEHYHQQYLHKVPNGYCGMGGTGLTCPVGLNT